jgi:hypothetical protein
MTEEKIMLTYNSEGNASPRYSPADYKCQGSQRKLTARSSSCACYRDVYYGSGLVGGKEGAGWLGV